VVSCIALRSMFILLQNLARGYPYYTTIGSSGTVDSEAADQEGVVSVLVWFGSILVVAGSIAYREGGCRTFNLSNAGRRNGYERIAQADGQSARRKATPPQIIAAPSATAANVYNMFDPADLPPRLAEYANMVYSACEDLGNFFGFQDSSVRNQAEHLLILLSNNRRYMSSHILPPSVQPPSPIHALHAKVFSNYVKWCRAMGVNPYFSKMNTSMNAPPAVASRVVDLVLFFCVWGEAANLRHMAECIWFLYHKMMQEYVRSEGYTQTRSLYAGHFLDTVVTPIFVIVKTVRRTTPRSGMFVSPTNLPPNVCRI
jgi:callose synthase